MPYDPNYHDEEPTREEIDHTGGLVLLEFGANWCGYCQGTAPAVKAVLSEQPEVQHVRIADGRGKPLGRSFRVKLWPTLVFLRDGQPVAQLVRPTEDEIRKAMEQLLAG